MPGTSCPRRVSARISGILSSIIQGLVTMAKAVRGESRPDRQPRSERQVLGGWSAASGAVLAGADPVGDEAAAGVGTGNTALERVNTSPVIGMDE